MWAMGGAVKPPARCCSKSHRICQMRPSMKPIAIATEISKTISSTKVIGMFPSGQCHQVARPKVTGPFLHGGFGNRSRSRGLLTKWPRKKALRKTAAPDLPLGVSLISFRCSIWRRYWLKVP
jgi:hypothetical protein